MNIPGRGKAGDNYGAGTKAAPLTAFTQCFKSGEEKSETVAATGHVFVPEHREIFRRARRRKKKEQEKEKSEKMKLIYQHSTDPVVITV